jgi:serine/threonine-protein kinase
MGTNEPFTLGSQVGRYTLEAVVGQGGMGVVYRAYDADLLRRVAVKVMTPNLTTSTALGRFQREAAAVAQLRHPGIAAVHDFGRHDGKPYIVFEWIEGRSLTVAMEEAVRLPVERALKLTYQMTSALDYAHQRGILHRDLKPGNVLVTPDDSPIIIDFGLAWLASDHTLTMPGALFGTPRYMAPEQFRGEMLDARADLYSLAVIAYEMLAGRPPFLGESIPAYYHQHLYTPPLDITDFVPDLPASVVAALRRALAKDAALRFASGAAFSAALRDMPPPVEVRPTDTMAQTVPLMSVPSTRPPQSKPRLAVASGGAPQAQAAAESQLTVPDAAPAEPTPAPPATQPVSRGNRRLLGIIAALLITFCVVWAMALGMVLPRGPNAPATLTRAATSVIAGAPSNAPLTTEALPTPAQAAPTTQAAGPSATRGLTQTPIVVTVVVTNVVVNITATGQPTSRFTPTPTLTATPTLTVGPGTPSNTPQPSATPQPTATLQLPATRTPTSPPTLTSVGAPSPTLTPPPTATWTPSATWTNVPTNTSPPTATNTAVPPTATFTATPPPTPTAGCALSGGSLTVTGVSLSWSLQNQGGAVVTIVAIDLNWPDVPPQQRFERAFLDSTEIANSNDNQPPSALPGEIAWLGPAADRQLGGGQTRTLRFDFNRDLPFTGLSVSVSFDNGCSLNTSN